MNWPAVRIVTDSSCDLPAPIADALGITIIPLSIRFGDEEFIDREELSTEEFWSKCVTSAKLPETAAPAPGQFEQAYRRLASEGATGIVVVSLSGALSATMQSAQLAARSIKPIIEVTGGVVEQGGKQRTRSKALAFLVEKVKSYDGAIENLAVPVSYTHLTLPTICSV